jgi:ribosomal RNA-processing protein 12
MVAAGLTAATPHMISASINALSRLLFEFKGKFKIFYLFLLSLPLCESLKSPVLTSCLPPRLSLSNLWIQLTPRFHLDLNNFRTSSNNHRFPSIQKPRNRKISPRFHQSSNCRSTHRLSHTTPPSPRTRITRLGPRSQESFQAKDCPYFREND